MQSACQFACYFADEPHLPSCPPCSPYQRGGIVTQHKGSKTLAFKPLGQAIAEPGEFLLSDFSKASGYQLGTGVGVCGCIVFSLGPARRNVALRSAICALHAAPGLPAKALNQ